MTELDLLRKMLNDAGIPYEDCSGINTNQIVYGRYGDGCPEWKLDAVCHAGSYGYYDGLIEIWGDLVGEEPVGYLLAAEVFAIIKEDYERSRDNVG